MIGTKLELTWIGKEDQPRLEPRILIERPEYSVPAKDGSPDGILIQGDNLLALKALEAQFAGKMKCIYIDPPFNTQQALDNYEDGLEHSLWLSLMRDRLIHLKRLLHDEGTIFIHIDDNELGYLIVLCDEVFGRNNRKHVITFKQGSATGHKAINPGCVSTTNFILVYCRNAAAWKPKRLFTARERDTRYNRYILNRSEEAEHWQFATLMHGFAVSQGLTAVEARCLIKENPGALDSFVLENADSVVQLARPNYNAVSKAIQKIIDESKQSRTSIFHIRREGLSDVYLLGGMRVLFYSGKLKMIDGADVAGEPLTTLWDDILSNNIHKEGGVDFPKGKKPEALIKRCIDLTTEAGDLVLDSFAGSGTTGAVAQKMGRRWIMIELGEHALTHIAPRLKSVVDGTDIAGVTEATGWAGGGGFRFYRLAPSLLERDRWGNWVISKEYDAPMLAEAMCRHMGFTYAPSQDQQEYWRHGHSTECDYIYVTTQPLTHEMLAALSAEVGPERYLLVCCRAYKGKFDVFDNLTVRKIPHAILSTCEWGRDDYSLGVGSMDTAEVLAPEGAPEPQHSTRRSRKLKTVEAVASPDLFVTAVASGEG